jgi:hypothetical protein
MAIGRGSARMNGERRRETASRAPRSRFRAFLAAVLFISGCRGEPAGSGFERYIPDPATARSAVVSVLEGWRDGRPIDEPSGRKPAVCVVDKQRKPGQRLARFEVLGEVSTDGARGFAARLTLENPDREHVARFLVIGIDPLWVFRQEDYEMFSHWMHPMDEATNPSTPKETGPTP